MTKSEYNKKWYKANKAYKKTYSRLHYRENQGLDGAGTAICYLIADRLGQISGGRWIDERTGKAYHGIA